jgi:hypothetical protein
MAETLVDTTAERPVTGTSAQPATDHGERIISPPGDVLRDIARGGIAGLIVGIVVAGLGGRLVMRLATILHEDTVGRITENGEVIGRISLNGTLALIVFGGLGMGLVAGVIWVIVGPWIPGRGLRRAAITALAAVALGTPALVQRSNPDFVVLAHDPLILAMLLVLVAAVGFSIALVDGALECRLPPAFANAGMATIAYLVVTLLGLVLIVPVVVAILLDQPEYRAAIRMGWGLAVVGGCTLASWVLRVRRRPAQPRALLFAARGALIATVVLGVVTSLPHVMAAAGLPR